MIIIIIFTLAFTIIDHNINHLLLWETTCSGRFKKLFFFLIWKKRFLLLRIASCPLAFSSLAKVPYQKICLNFI